SCSTRLADWLANMPSTCRSRAASPGVIRARCARSIGPSSGASGGEGIHSIPFALKGMFGGGGVLVFFVVEHAGLDQQTQRWLRERLTYPPTLRLVFDQESPQFANSRKKPVHH